MINLYSIGIIWINEFRWFSGFDSDSKEDLAIKFTKAKVYENT